jgi:poly(3-hydroxyalkanoate) synthetase
MWLIIGGAGVVKEIKVMRKAGFNVMNFMSDDLKEFLEIMPFHMMRMMEGQRGAFKDSMDVVSKEMVAFQSAWAVTLIKMNPYLMLNPFIGGFLKENGREDLFHYFDRKRRQFASFLELRAGELDKEVEKEFGFQFGDGVWTKIAETPRVELWLVRDYKDMLDKVPLIMVPPMILSPGVLAWEKGRSFVHYLSDRGIPTGVIVNKDILKNVAVQDMTMEEHILDTRDMCIEAGKYFGKTQVVLGGYCQGSECALRSLATGKLKGIASYGLLGVSPIDPTDVGTLYDNYHNLPEKITLEDAAIILPNGRKVIHGDIMRAVIEYGNPEANNPWSQMLRDLAICDGGKPSKGSLKMWYWLNRTIHLPYKIIQLTNITYQHPIVDGVYGYELFGERPDLKRLGEFGVRSLFIGTAEKDTLVKQESSVFLVSLLRKIIDVNLCQYNKGHLGMVRDCVMPKSDEPLDGYSLKGQPGPVIWYNKNVRRHPLEA